MMDTAPKTIVIVGGGTAGWLTAAYLVKVTGQLYPLRVILVEAADIGVIGVGEATIPTLRRTLQDIGVPEDEFLAGVNGGFKQAIRFQNWLYDPAHSPTYFYHPFHKASVTNIYAAAHYLGLCPDAASDVYGRFSTPQVMACDAYKAPLSLEGEDKAKLTYAYHMDAVLFGQFLRQRFEGKGVERIEGKVCGVSFHEGGDIRAVILEDAQQIEADLFIDCSGFRGLLINQQLSVPFRSFQEWLPCDKAVAVSVPYREGEAIRPYTVATAQKAGWIWDINLASRRGVGHVYSSAHQSAAEAEAALLAYVQDPDNRLGLQFRHIGMRVGRCERLWERNCVAIGLAGGFIEPLESTGIFLIEMGIRLLLDNWPMEGEVEHRRRHYNALMHRHYDEVLFFVLMHYVTSQRRDSAFWRDITRERPLPLGLGEMLALWRHKLPSVYDTSPLTAPVFGYESYIAILAGMGFFRGMRSNHAINNRQALASHLSHSQEEFKHAVGALAGHAEYLMAARARVVGKA